MKREIYEQQMLLRQLETVNSFVGAVWKEWLTDCAKGISNGEASRFYNYLRTKVSASVARVQHDVDPSYKPKNLSNEEN